MAEYNASGVLQAKYHSGALGLLAMKRSGGSAHWYLCDALGTVRRLADTSGSVTDYYFMDAWGKLESSSGSTANPFRYVGRENYYSDPTDLPDLLLLGVRYYSSSLGRFITPDPVGLAGGDYNIYRYGKDDPLGRTDPSGMATCNELRKLKEKCLGYSLGSRSRIDCWYQFYGGVTDYLTANNCPTAANMFSQWLYGGGGEVAGPSAVLQDENVAQFMEDTKDCLVPRFVGVPNRADGRESHYWHTSVWPKKTDYQGAFGYIDLKAWAVCSVPKKCKCTDCEISWVLRKEWNWDAGSGKTVPGLPGCRMEIADSWAAELNGYYGNYFVVLWQIGPQSFKTNCRVNRKGTPPACPLANPPNR